MPVTGVEIAGLIVAIGALSIGGVSTIFGMISGYRGAVFTVINETPDSLIDISTYSYAGDVKTLITKLDSLQKGAIAYSSHQGALYGHENVFVVKIKDAYSPYNLYHFAVAMSNPFDWNLYGPATLAIGWIDSSSYPYANKALYDKMMATADGVPISSSAGQFVKKGSDIGRVIYVTDATGQYRLQASITNQYKSEINVHVERMTGYWGHDPDDPDWIPQQDCYAQRSCNLGYMDKTNGAHTTNWACASGCPGGPFTDWVCNCACIPRAPCSSAVSLPFVENTQWQLIILVGILSVIFCNGVICCIIKRHCAKKTATDIKFSKVNQFDNYENENENENGGVDVVALL